MEPAEAQKQIEQMINFILCEAKDRAQEIESRTIEEFNLEKLRIVNSMKLKITEEYQLRSKKIETQRAIDKSRAINKARLEVVQNRDEIVNSCIDNSKAYLQKFVKSKEYKVLLQSLVVQGCLSLVEDAVTVRCRKDDISTVQSIVNGAEEIYSKILASQIPNCVRKTKISVDTKNFLSCIGGVVVACMDGKIRVDNTLDSRLSLKVEKDKPGIRRVLFS